MFPTLLQVVAGSEGQERVTVLADGMCSLEVGEGGPAILGQCQLCLVSGVSWALQMLKGEGTAAGAAGFITVIFHSLKHSLMWT